ncbi:DNA polymerase delta subunit 2 [Anthonomus grandis grandis]|uniref:DNA polymerase delta subunit 2 n=1 Tax=Anthonomus grandis grandis TaxID=2921223 RepID=UPI00216511FB|nr:DNA polymerase delta subunit 2 [Anthonomus grandis grandis]
MPEQIERKCVKYKNCSKKFIQKSPDFSKQFCSIYLARLRDMEGLLVERVQQKWGDKYPICQLHKLTEEGYDKCVVIGTLFKDQRLKPSVLKQLAESNQLVPQPIVTHFTDESDALFMEDEVQRYRLIGDMDPTKLVTGIICAVLGRDIGKGKFQVEEFIFSGCRDQIERPVFKDSIYILFLSGLDFIHSERFLPNLQLLTYWLSGAFGDIDKVSKVCRVIIAGNSIRTEPPKKKACISMISRISESTDSFEAVGTFDKFLLRICQVVDVDLMPGENDPSNHILPQQPLHFCMFPESAQYKSFNQVTNPYHCELDNLKLMGSSGQPVRDIMRFSDITDSLEAMECCFTWNHLAPTAPDTLGCFPYYNKDPFILDECPHVYFAGNQTEFASKVITGENGQQIRLISIPKFSETFQGVLLNVQSLDCEVVSFETK